MEIFLPPQRFSHASFANILKNVNFHLLVYYFYFYFIIDLRIKFIFSHVLHVQELLCFFFVYFPSNVIFYFNNCFHCFIQ